MYSNKVLIKKTFYIIYEYDNYLKIFEWLKSVHYNKPYLSFQHPYIYLYLCSIFPYHHSLLLLKKNKEALLKNIKIQIINQALLKKLLVQDQLSIPHY